LPFIAIFDALTLSSDNDLPWPVAANCARALRHRYPPSLCASCYLSHPHIKSPRSRLTAEDLLTYARLQYQSSYQCFPL